MKKLSKDISIFLLKKNMDWSEDLSILEYSITLFLESTLITIVLILISIAKNQLMDGLFLILFMVILRNIFGTAHAKTFWNCFFISSLIFIVGLQMILWTKNLSGSQFLLIVLITFFFYFNSRKDERKFFCFGFIVLASVTLGYFGLRLGKIILITCLLVALIDFIFRAGDKNEK